MGRNWTLSRFNLPTITFQRVAAKASSGSMLLVSCGNAGLVALDSKTLQERWRSPAAHSISIPALVSDLDADGKQDVIACTDDGKVLILDSETGTLRLDEPITPGESLMPHAAALLSPNHGKPARLFVTCSNKDTPDPPAALLRAKTLALKR